LASYPLFNAETLEESCGDGDHRSYTMNTCLHCNKETRNPKYCSKSCAAKETNKTSKRQRKVYTCKSCCVPVPHDRTKCDACLEVKDISLEQAIYTKHHKSSAFALVRSRARSSVRGEEQVCEECGYSKHIEVCHIKPIHAFPLSTMLSEINHRDNLKILCPNCHWEFDHLSN
jgi:hypothetical protein